MAWNDKHKDAGKSIFMQSVTGLANVVAVAAAFLLTPKLHSYSVEWVQTFTRESYGYGWDDLVWLAWWGICCASIFFVSRMTIGTLMIMGGMALMTRFL